MTSEEAMLLDIQLSSMRMVKNIENDIRKTFESMGCEVSINFDFKIERIDLETFQKELLRHYIERSSRK